MINVLAMKVCIAYGFDLILFDTLPKKIVDLNC